jgi:hypothetical protein
MVYLIWIAAYFAIATPVAIILGRAIAVGSGED